MSVADLEELARERVGQTLEGKWTIEALLGVGGVAAVYRARHKNGNKVAVKILHERFHREKSIRQRFLREARIANQVDHPAVIRFHDDGTTDDGAPFLVTELLSGKNLEDYRASAGGTLPLDEVVRIGALVLSVLEIAHAAGVIHRDLKPANLFRSEDGELFVLDFGLARALEDTDEGSQLTSADSLLGTVGYMAPEQAQGRWDLVGPQTDLFAVGATLLKLATGLDVHESNTAQGRLVLAATKPVQKTRERAPALPQDFCDALDRSLAFAQKDRFSSAITFRHALTGVVSSAKSGSLMPAAGPAPARRSRLWALAVVALSGAVVAIVVTSNSRAQKPIATDSVTSNSVTSSSAPLPADTHANASATASAPSTSTGTSAVTSAGTRAGPSVGVGASSSATTVATASASTAKIATTTSAKLPHVGSARPPTSAAASQSGSNDDPLDKRH